MNQGVTTVLYPVRDINQAKKLYTSLLGVEPIVDQPYYVGYRLGNQDIGLVPNGFDQRMIGTTAFYQVSDIKENLESIRQSGGQVVQEPRDVGGGKLTASAKDADNNMIGLIQMP
jgi:predicted enzyme related to lactoylglutathione lyase